MKGLQYKFFQCNCNFAAEAFKETVDATLKKACLFKRWFVGAKQAFFINQILRKICMKCKTPVVIEEVISNFDIVFL